MQHTSSDNPRNLGPQPLNDLMGQLDIENHDVVSASTEQITHKMVARGRKGRLLTKNTQQKLLNAVNNLGKGSFSLTDLFNYSGK